MVERNRNINDLEPLNGVFGYPPSTYVSDDMIINSMPVLEIFPSTPVFESGLTLFRVEDAWEDYSKMLYNTGYRIKDASRGPLRVAYIADSFPTESFSNDYGESFLQKMTDVASQGVSELMQMTGTKSMGEGADKIIASFQEFGAGGGENASNFRKLVGGGANMAASAKAGLVDLKNAARDSNSAIGQTFGGGVDVLDKLMAGHRVDFPIIWRNAGFNPNYQITIRLYNPNPGSFESTQKNIVGPLAAILLLAIPGSEDGRTYTWPYFHKIRCSGLFDLNPAVITNITVIKGGDQQQIAYNQRVGIVDIRMDFRSVFNSMLFDRANTTLAGRPTLKNYLDQLGKDDRKVYRTRKQMRENHASLAPNIPDTPILFPPRVPSSTLEKAEQTTSNNNAIRARRPKTSVVEVTDRTALCSKLLELNLTSQNDPLYKNSNRTPITINGFDFNIPDSLLKELFPEAGTPGWPTQEDIDAISGSCTAWNNASTGNVF